MFKVNDFRVRYRHLDDSHGQLPDARFREFFQMVEDEGLAGRDICGITECMVEEWDYQAEQWFEIAYGRAFCRLPDQFNRKVGRKLAFTRAMQSPELDKEEKRDIWEAFFTSEGVKRGKEVESRQVVVIEHVRRADGNGTDPVSRIA